MNNISTTSFPNLIAVALVVVVACRGDFESYNEVSDLRVLAIAADKPEVIGDENVTFSALVTETGASYQWHWCPLPRPQSEGLGCTVDDTQLAQLVQSALGDAAFDLPPLDMGREETASFTNPIGPLEGRQLCQALVTLAPEEAGRPDCLSGVFPLSITLEVTSASGNDSVLASRTLGVLLDSMDVPNENPSFSEIRIELPGDDAELIAVDGSTRVETGQDYEVIANAEEESAETYLDDTRVGQPAQAREGLVFSWFYEVGSFELGRSSYAENERPVSQLNTNSWTIPEGSPTGPTRIWLVLRDTRGGVSWLERELVLGGAQ